jgi:hypothetical protein
MKAKSILIVIASLAVGVFLGFVGCQYYSPVYQCSSDLLEQIERSANLVIDFGDGRVLTYPNKHFDNGETAFGFTSKISEVNSLSLAYEEYAGLGVLVTEIGDKKNGEDNKYWQYWVNGVSPEVGAGNYKIQKGDVIEWKFLKYQGNE